jgi:hypothetical protein
LAAAGLDAWLRRGTDAIRGRRSEHITSAWLVASAPRRRSDCPAPAQPQLHLGESDHRREDRRHVAFLLARPGISVPPADCERAAGPDDLSSGE